MAAGTQSETDPISEPEPEPHDRPDVSVCESGPGTSVFLESENSDGWIASDLTIDVHR